MTNSIYKQYALEVENSLHTQQKCLTFDNHSPSKSESKIYIVIIFLILSLFDSIVDKESWVLRELSNVPNNLKCSILYNKAPFFLKVFIKLYQVISLWDTIDNDVLFPTKQYCILVLVLFWQQFTLNLHFLGSNKVQIWCTFQLKKKVSEQYLLMKLL